MMTTIRHFLRSRFPTRDRPAPEAYDLWSGSYDDQPDNLMLYLDRGIFEEFINTLDLKGKKIADIGCGTGRHWEMLYDKEPALLTGFDVSPGMLSQLRKKFPDAQTHLLSDDSLNMIPDASMDLVISTLTIAHIKNISKAISAWARILKTNGDLIITDFHPVALAKGGRRTFRHDGMSLSVKNFVHPLNKLIGILKKNHFIIEHLRERYVDDSVRSYYEAQHALHVYHRFLHMPVIYGLHLKKQDAPN